VSDVRRAAFAEILKQLIATKRIWMVVTLRADFYDLFIKDPVLKSLKEAGASLDLGPPGLAELADIVRRRRKRRGSPSKVIPQKARSTSDCSPMPRLRQSSASAIHAAAALPATCGDQGRDAVDAQGL